MAATLFVKTPDDGIINLSVVDSITVVPTDEEGGRLNVYAWRKTSARIPGQGTRIMLAEAIPPAVAEELTRLVLAGQVTELTTAQWAQRRLHLEELAGVDRTERAVYAMEGDEPARTITTAINFVGAELTPEGITYVNSLRARALGGLAWSEDYDDLRNRLRIIAVALGATEDELEKAESSDG